MTKVNTLLEISCYKKTQTNPKFSLSSPRSTSSTGTGAGSHSTGRLHQNDQFGFRRSTSFWDGRNIWRIE
jgi:hypothetical protein